MDLMATLGLDKVEGDPNALPDGRYLGVIFKSEYVHVPNKNSYSHVITYQVVDGAKKGAQKPEWFTIGTDPVFGEDGKTLESLTLTMTETAKDWYKKRLLDLGVSEEEVPTFKPESLVGKPVVFGIKKKDGYRNINFVELREATAAPVAAQGSLSGLL